MQANRSSGISEKGGQATNRLQGVKTNFGRFSGRGSPSDARTFPNPHETLATMISPEPSLNSGRPATAPAHRVTHSERHLQSTPGRTKLAEKEPQRPRRIHHPHALVTHDFPLFPEAVAPRHPSVGGLLHARGRTGLVSVVPAEDQKGRPRRRNAAPATSPRPRASPHQDRPAGCRARLCRRRSRFSPSRSPARRRFAG